MTALSARQFYKAIKGSYGPILEPRGFSTKESKRANFTRWVSKDICHVFCFGRTRDLSRYHAWCFATSPLIQEDFETRFPDSLNAVMVPYVLDPTDIVSVEQRPLFCKNEDAFLTCFNRDVRPILGRAVDFLDTIMKLDDLERFAVGGGGAIIRDVLAS
jgi:hypothetical protein